MAELGEKDIIFNPLGKWGPTYRGRGMVQTNLDGSAVIYPAEPMKCRWPFWRRVVFCIAEHRLAWHYWFGGRS